MNLISWFPTRRLVARPTAQIETIETIESLVSLVIPLQIQNLQSISFDKLVAIWRYGNILISNIHEYSMWGTDIKCRATRWRWPRIDKWDHQLAVAVAPLPRVPRGRAGRGSSSGWAVGAVGHSDSRAESTCLSSRDVNLANTYLWLSILPTLPDSSPLDSSHSRGGT